MKLDIKRAVHLGGLDYKPGIHEVPDFVAENWFFKALLKAGEIILLHAIAPQPAEEVKQESSAALDSESEAAQSAPEDIEEAPKGKKKKKN